MTDGCLIHPCPKKGEPKRLKGEAKNNLNLEVWERDNRKCVFCNANVPETYPSHHIMRKSQGAADDPNEMITICPRCDYLLHHGDIYKLMTILNDMWKARDIIEAFLMGWICILNRRVK
jgi:hypothetical protein